MTEFYVWAGAWLVVGFVGAYLTAVLRVKRIIICRTESRIDAVVNFAFWIPLVKAMWDAAGWQGVVYMPLALVAGQVIMWKTNGGWARRLKNHWRHEEDCKYGPRRRRGGAAAKLRTWRKVAIRPIAVPT